MDLGDLRETLRELLQFLRNVELHARRRQNLITYLENEVQPQ